MDFTTDNGFFLISLHIHSVSIDSFELVVSVYFIGEFATEPMSLQHGSEPNQHLKLYHAALIHDPMTTSNFLVLDFVFLDQTFESL